MGTKNIAIAGVVPDEDWDDLMVRPPEPKRKLRDIAKNALTKAAEKAGDAVAKVGALSPAQVAEVEKNRQKYLSQKPDPNDPAAKELTERLLAEAGVKIFNAYLPQLSDLYVPVRSDAELGKGNSFRAEYNIRYINITKWVMDKKENNLEKLVNVYEVLSNEHCNIALIFNRRCENTSVYLAVVNTDNADNNTDIDACLERLKGAVKGNFPGSEWLGEGKGTPRIFPKKATYSVAAASNIPGEKSEKFISQTIEKLLDGYVPEIGEQEYTLILLATPVLTVEQRKLTLSEMYSALTPYASWQTDFTYNENMATGSSATAGINVGVSAGIQNTQNQTTTEGTSKTDNQSKTDTETKSKATGENISQSDAKGESSTTTHQEGSNEAQAKTTGTNASTTVGRNASQTVSASASANVSISGVGSAGVEVSESTTIGASVSETVGVSSSDTLTFGTSVSDAVSEAISKTVTETVGKTLSETVGNSVAQSVGKAFSKTLSVAEGVAKSVNFGANFGANFARSSSTTATIGKSETIHQNFVNYSIKHALELLEAQVKRLDESSALGMWDFAAYVLSEDLNMANNVAHGYIALTQGEGSHLSNAAINLWRGDLGDDSTDAHEIYQYLRELRHPLFGLDPNVVEWDPSFNVYPNLVTATTSLSGRELAYSLNFPQRSVAGLPIIECAEFGRNVVTYDTPGSSCLTAQDTFELGHIFHMNREESNPVWLSAQSLTSHTFITGSTGSGKSNTVYALLEDALESGIPFLVVEPAKGEYKEVFGRESGVSVFGTNPRLSPMLKINPFSFLPEIHILEHLDRLIEIFNVCWPMYAAMPAVLKSAVEKSYQDAGWNLRSSQNIYGENIFPTFADVAKNIKTIIDTSEYDTENKGAYKGSLLTRLESLTNGLNGMIFVQDEISPELMFDTNVIVDLSRVGSSETKSLIMGMLVLKLQEYRMCKRGAMNARLRHLTVLEEAHNLLKRTSTEQTSEGSNLLGKSVEMLAGAIAEMRSYGEGFVIVDQAPGLMDLSVIRNTNTKIIMRLPDLSDRELAGRAANLDDDQITELAKLPLGVAAVYQNDWIMPVLCKVRRQGASAVPYAYAPDETDDIFGEASDELITQDLTACLLKEELVNGQERSRIGKLKDRVIKSGLSTAVKCDYLAYLKADGGDAALQALEKLAFDYFGAEEAIAAAESCRDIESWTERVLAGLSLETEAYSLHQRELLLARILFEQSRRDVVYKDVLLKYTEIHQSMGGAW